MPRSSVVIDELCPAWTPLPTRRKRRPTFPSKGNVVNLAKVVIGKEFTTSVKTSVAATISRHAIFCGGRLPPLRRVLRCAVTGRFLKLMTLPLRGSCLRSRLKRCPPMPRSSVVIDELCPAWTPLPTRRKRRPTFPSRGRLLETAPLKLMTLPPRGRLSEAAPLKSMALPSTQGKPPRLPGGNTVG